MTIKGLPITFGFGQKPPFRNHYFRLRFMVHPKFQLTLILANFAILVGSFIAVSFALSRYNARVSELSRIFHLDSQSPFNQLLGHHETTLYLALTVILLIALGLSMAVTLYLSHKAAGPFIRTMGYFQNITNSGGEVKDKLGFRAGDFFSELAPTVNDALGSVQSRSTKSRN